MARLVEMVFEGASEQQVVTILGVLGCLDRFEALHHQASDSGLGEATIGALRLAGKYELRNAHVRLLTYQGGPFDIEVNFDLDEIETLGSSFQVSLHGFAVAIAKACGVRSYYCGYEPAADEETRLFTGERLGPLMI